MKQIAQLLMAAAMLYAPASVTAQALTLNLKKSAKYEAVSESKGNTTIEAMGQSMEMNVDSKSTTVYEVKDSRASEFDLVKTLTKSTMNMSMMGQEMSYDSEKKDNDPKIAEALGALLGKPVNITVNQKGHVLKSDAPKESGSEQVTMMGDIMKTIMVNETDELLAGPVLNRNLKPGEQWQDSTSSKAEKMSMKITGVYTVNTVENGVASVTFNGIQTTTGTIDQQGIEMATSGNNKITSQITINMNTGVVIQRITTVAVNMNIEFMGTTIPATGSISNTTNVKEIQ